MKKYPILLCLLFISFFIYSQENVVSNNVSNVLQKEINSKQKIKVFPNPAVNVVNILGLSNSNRANIVVTDSYDNNVLQYNWAIRKKAISIPVAQLNPGLYIITIISKEQQVQVKFFKN